MISVNALYLLITVNGGKINPKINSPFMFWLALTQTGSILSLIHVHDQNSADSTNCSKGNALYMGEKFYSHTISITRSPGFIFLCLFVFANYGSSCSNWLLLGAWITLRSAERRSYRFVHVSPCPLSPPPPPQRGMSKPLFLAVIGVLRIVSSSTPVILYYNLSMVVL